MSNQKEYEQFCTITGVIDNNIVQQSTLDEFVKRHPEVMIVDDDTSVFDIAKKYASEHKVDGTLFFIDCSAFHNQYKHWYGSFKIIQPYYGIPDSFAAECDNTSYEVQPQRGDSWFDGNSS